MSEISKVAARSAADASQDAGKKIASNRGFFKRLVDALSPAESKEAINGVGVPKSITNSMPGILNLRRMRVEDVAIPKADIVAIPASSSLKQLVEAFRSSGLTRLPVFDGTLDTPIGLANLKDLALRHGFNTAKGKFDLREMLRPLLFVPPSMPIGVLLQKMQADRIHMALVIDEYGGTDGLVTIEDLIEQVVGEIEDEHDLEEEVFFLLEEPEVWLALAKTPLDEFEEEIGCNLRAHREIDEEEVDTLGGLVAMLAGKVPVRGEVIAHPDGPEFEVVDADLRRIKRLRVRLKPVGAA